MFAIICRTVALSFCLFVSLSYTVTAFSVSARSYPGRAIAEHGPEQQQQQPLPDRFPLPDTLNSILSAVRILQADYFSLWQGIWPSGIDWTSAVTGTHLASTLATFSSSLPRFLAPASADNVINKYFSQLTASYFGQDVFALRQQANDDMLWVVLEWLEGIKFIDAYASRHRPEIGNAWHGEQWIPTFAHRARVFWDLASKGWNTTLCGGGMIWNSAILPYKNAITNELYISASIAMYLYFPGDNNASPFQASQINDSTGDTPGKPHDPKYLAAAVECYNWLLNSNMTNSQGLFVDGFHISGWTTNPNSSANTRCDERNEMVYTYNQGVLLSGQYGLYLATGARFYLEDGHQLVANVIAATGWDLRNQSVPSDRVNTTNGLGQWKGLGRSGVLEEMCDSSGTCSQDGQTFKGIFFEHLTIFCAHLPDFLSVTNGTSNKNNPQNIQEWHDEKCADYSPWVRHNAQAALSTLNSKDKFGMWWGAPKNASGSISAEAVLSPGAVDYRNLGLPSNWTMQHQRRMNTGSAIHTKDTRLADPNDRGRGRTLETQGGGLSVLRALWELMTSR